MQPVLIVNDREIGPIGKDIQVAGFQLTLFSSFRNSPSNVWNTRETVASINPNENELILINSDYYNEAELELGGENNSLKVICRNNVIYEHSIK